MLKATMDNMRGQFESFAKVLHEYAERHVRNGEVAAAGVLFVAEAQLKTGTFLWGQEAELLIEDGDEPEIEIAPAKPAARHRHDFVESIAKGENPPRCACGHVKNPNGRPRGQQVIAPGGGS